MSKCKTVTLRKRKIKNGTQYSLCLDYYPGYRDNTTMKVITREALGIYIFAKPANQQERDFNARMMKKAEILRNRRYEAIFNENNGFFDKAKMKGDFLAYFKALADRKNIKWRHVYKHFERFVNGRCTFEEVDVDLCRKFMEYLLGAPQSIGCFVVIPYSMYLLQTFGEPSNMTLNKKRRLIIRGWTFIK